MGKFYEGLGDQLSLYVRQSAWLNTAPDKAELSRLQAMEKDQLEPDLPEVDAPWLLGHFWEAGPTSPGPMGEAPLSFQEIQAWQQQTGTELAPWAVRLLRRLSREYLEAAHAARSADCPAPYTSPEGARRNAQAIDRQIRLAMKSYFAAKGAT